LFGLLVKFLKGRQRLSPLLRSVVMKKSYSQGMDLDERGRSASSASCLSNYSVCYNDPYSQNQKAWSLSDSQIPPNQRPRLPLKSFNHISKEVINLEKSKNFYCDLLGFVVVPRPPFEADGYWLWGYNLSLHLVSTGDRRKRKSVLKARYEHFTEALPRVDHFAFMTDDIAHVKEILDQANVFYKYEKPSGTGIEQLFFFDPDGNVIEVSTCTGISTDGINWCHTLPGEEPSRPRSCTNTGTPAMDVIDSVAFSEYCDMEAPDVQIRNIVEFAFSDGTREQVVIGAINIGDKSNYALDDADFYSHRGSDDSTGSHCSTPLSSSCHSLEMPSAEAVCIATQFRLGEIVEAFTSIDKEMSTR
jgi:catechol 2,3-dioxygenase-like lactoylglutathione lyase family enzyme